MSLSALKQFYAQLSGDVNVAAICKKAAEGQFDFYFPAPASRSDDDILDAINSAMGKCAATRKALRSTSNQTSPLYAVARGRDL